MRAICTSKAHRRTSITWIALDRVNGEGIFYTRPWKINGEGPSMNVHLSQVKFNEDKQPDLTADDIRFTTKGDTMYAFVQGWPQSAVTIKALGTESPQQPQKVVNVKMLGPTEALRFTQDAGGLKIVLAGDKPQTAGLGIALKINFA